jgi:WD40 repeat protein
MLEQVGPACRAIPGPVLKETAVLHPRLVLALVVLFALAAPGSADPLPAKEAPKTEQPLIKIWHGTAATAVVFSPDGKVLASAGEDGLLRLLDTATGKELHQVKFQAPIRALAYSHDGKMLAAKIDFGAMKIYDPATMKELKESPSHSATSLVLAFSADNSTLTGAAPWEYEFWEHTRGSMSSSRSGGFPANSFAALSPDGKTVVWGSGDGNLQFMQPQGGGWRQMQVGRVNHAAFSPDNKLLATANTDKIIRVWDAANGKEVRKFTAANEEPGLLAFAGDGKTLVSAGKKDAVLRLWDVATGKELKQVSGPRGGALRSLALAPDGKKVATASGDGRMRYWDLDNPAEAPPASGTLTAKDLDASYADLVNADPAKARRAFAALLAGSKESVPYLQQRVRAVAGLKIDPRVGKLIAELDDDDFSVRDNASQELAKVGESVVPALQQTLASNPSPEVKDRIGQLLKNFKDASKLTPDLMRVLEALEVLEQAGTPEARQALEGLARESLVARIMQEVKAAVERLPK